MKLKFFFPRIFTYTQTVFIFPLHYSQSFTYSPTHSLADFVVPAIALEHLTEAKLPSKCKSHIITNRKEKLINLANFLQIYTEIPVLTVPALHTVMGHCYAEF